MSEEIILRYALNQDYLSKKGMDHRLICRLDVEPSAALRSQAPPSFCDVCLVLDGSGSMNEPFAAGYSMTKREGVIDGAKRLVEHLDPGDTVSLVFYDSRAYTVGELMPGDRPDAIRQSIDSLSEYSGATNFEAALKAAKAVLSKGRNPIRRIIFLTDGQVNEGNSREVDSTVAELSREGVTIDGLGVGADFNFNYMRGLSGPSNGRTFLLSTPEEAGRRFEELLSAAQKAAATNVFLTALFAKGLRDVEAFQWLPEMRYYGELSPNPDGLSRLEVNVQTLRKDQRNIFFFAVRMDPPQKESTALLANVRLDFDLPSAKQTGLQENVNIFVNFSADDNETQYDSDVENGFMEVGLSKLDQQFQSLRGGDWQKALSVLDEMIQRARDLGDQNRLSQYQAHRKKLQKDHFLSDDDFNRVGSSSSLSTRTEEGYLENPEDDDLLSRL
ncbi:MAG: vWA domain-containing protein [Desulfococcaceae bacterium]